MRRQVLPGFTKGSVESWKPLVDKLAGDLISSVLATPNADIVTALAVPMPMTMIMHILGVPAEDESVFRDWSNETIRIADVSVSARGLLQIGPTMAGFRKLHCFFTDRLRDGQLLGSDTLLGKLVANAEDGQISHDELFFFAILLLLAGNETTTNLLSTLFLTLSENPDQLELLRRDPDLIPAAIEEQLRYISPIQSFFRTATVDYPVGDTYIPAGARVLLAWGAANRDSAEYDDPDSFLVERNPGRHVAFGSGIHLCLGAHLARLEGQAVLREIVERVDRIEITGQPIWTTNPNLRGLTRLPVTLTGRAAAQSD